MPAPSTVLVVGATGKQGGAVVTALLALPSPPKILALTRNKSSAKAQALAAAHPNQVALVQGDISAPEAVFKAAGDGVDAVFLVTTPPKEAEHAIPFLDAAAAAGVRQVVFSSVDRGGEPRSWDNPTDIAHFLSKHEIELHLRALGDARPGAFTWTILRPTAFLDNLNPGMFCSIFTSMWSGALSPGRKLQFVATRDIGRWAARALADPDAFAGRAIGLAGDEISLDEAKDTFKKVTGKDLPSAWGVVGKGMLWAIGEVGRMFAFFEKEGYGVGIAALRKEDKELLDFEAWLREESLWKQEEPKA